MKSKKNLTPPRTVRLFKNDETSLRYEIKNGKYEDMSDAIRTTVANHLDTERLLKVFQDPVDIKLKKIASDVAEPVSEELNEVNKQMELMRGEMNELRSTLVTVLKNFSAGDVQIKTSSESSQANKIETKLSDLEEQIKFTKRIVMQSREDNFVLRGMMLFFNLGYTAGKFRPIEVVGEKIFLEALEEASHEIILKARARIEEGLKDKEEETLLQDFARKLATKSYDLVSPSSQNSE